MHNDHRTCMYVTPSVHGAYDYNRCQRFVGGDYDHTKSPDKVFISHKISFHWSHTWWYPIKWLKCVIHSKKWKSSSDFAWERRTSMSPRSNETHTFFENRRMYLTVCKFFSCGASGPFSVLLKIHKDYDFIFPLILNPILTPKRSVLGISGSPLF